MTDTLNKQQHQLIDVSKNEYYTKMLSQNQQIMIKLEQGYVDDAIEQLKLLHAEVLQKYQKQIPLVLDKLQVIIMTNLACSYRKKEKFNISLFYLKNVQNIEKKINTSDSEVGSTYSNLCAIYSQMGKHKQAYKQIKIGIKKLEKSLEEKFNQQVAINLIVSYHNCAIQCQYLGNYSSALDYAQKGIQQCEKLKLDSDIEIIMHLRETIDRVNQKKNKIEMKFSKFYEKQYKHRIYFKNRQDLDDTFEVKKKENLSIEVTRRMNAIRKTTPFPNIIVKRNKSLNVYSHKLKPNLSAYRVDSVRETITKNRSQYDPFSQRSEKQQLPYLKNRTKTHEKIQKTVSQHQSIQNNILQYSKTKAKNNFRKNKFSKVQK